MLLMGSDHRLRIFAALCLFGMAPLHATEPPHAKLIVTIVVDQYSSDLFTEYRPLYRTKEGLARLARGAVFPRGFQSHAATETCPGHSTILTGARPARTGIIANDWQDLRFPRLYGDRETFSVYCAEKPGEKGSDAKARVISPDSLLVPTLGDRMKARDASSRVVVVAGKDRSAVMLGGGRTDLTLWWTDGGFTTYRGKEAAIPQAISGRVNNAVRRSYGRPTPRTLPRQCAAHSQRIEVTPHVSVGMLQPTEANSRRWRATPAMDSLTVDAALAAVQALDLGRRDSIDLLAVGLSANDYVGHYFGTAGAEMCAQQLALDETIGRLLRALDKARIPYIVALTADHGGMDIPERSRLRGLPAAQRIDSELLPGKVGGDLARELGLEANVVLDQGDFASDVYLNPAIPADKHARALEAVMRKYRAHPQVETVFTKNELIAATHPGGPVDEWTLLDRAKASFHPARSGDVVVLLKPYVIPYGLPKDPDTDYIGSHGSPWGYDRRVPILFWWKGIRGFDQPVAVETVDILPTLASLIGLQIDMREVDGRVLRILSEERPSSPYQQ
jgi:predicted AlkP superfamily pyrophosphatase or phosphodiesterase